MATVQLESPLSRDRGLLGAGAGPSASEGWTGESGVSAGGQSEQLTSPGAVAPPPARRQGTATSCPHPPILKDSDSHVMRRCGSRPAWTWWCPTCDHTAAQPLSRQQQRVDLVLVHPQRAAQHPPPLLSLPAPLGNVDPQGVILHRDQHGPPPALHRLHSVQHQTRVRLAEGQTPHLQRHDGKSNAP